MSKAANHKTICKVQNILQDNLDNALRWFKYHMNLLLILINQYIILIEPKSQDWDHTVFVSLNGIQIQQSQEKSLLGLQTDNRPTLTFIPI